VRVALGTTILVFAEGVNGGERKIAAPRIINDPSGDEAVVPVQALGELYSVLTRKAGRPAVLTRKAVLGWLDAYSVADTSSAVLLDAMKLWMAHKFALRDAIMLAAAAASGCRLLLSEDMQDEFTWRGVRIRDPFRGATGQ
jgi:predicted nucleic acid-binding protein